MARLNFAIFQVARVILFFFFLKTERKEYSGRVETYEMNGGGIVSGSGRKVRFVVPSGISARAVSMHAIKSEGIRAQRGKETSPVDLVQVFVPFRRPFMV